MKLIDFADELPISADPANLPPNQIVTAKQLEMRPGQKLQDKAKELGCSRLTLRIWHAKWEGSNFDPEFVIRRRQSQWMKNRWQDRDWCEVVRQQLEKKQHRHVGDMLLELGLTTSTALLWTRAHPKFGDILWSAPHPKNHHPRFLAWVRCNTLNDYQERKAAHIAAGKGEMEAAHQAADEAINEFKHATRQRRRIERDVLLGVGGHEETLRRYRKGARLTDAYSRRIAKKLWSVSRWVAMERALTECGYSQKEIAETMSELMGAFKKSETAGQKKWKQIRDAVLRWRAAVDAAIKAGEVEASVLKTYAEQFGTQHVRKWVSKNY